MRNAAGRAEHTLRDAQLLLNEGRKMNANLELIRKCLALVGRIAARGACSASTQQVVDTLMELTFALENSRSPGDLANTMLESCRSQNLNRLLEELDEIDSTADRFAASDGLSFASRSPLN